MKKLAPLLLLLVIGLLSGAVFAQTPTPAPAFKRTIYKTDKLDFGSGGTLEITGAPVGSIRVEATAANEIEISATIEVHAQNEADLAKLAEVTGFVLEESLGRTGIISTGTHDKKFVKQFGKKFPRTALGMPFRIDYVIKVPRYCDLIVDGGRGDLSISGVDGVIKVNYLESDATIDLVGGSLTATVGKGNIDVSIPSRSWRGRFAEVQLASGTMDVKLPAGLNAEVDGTILRTGKIENMFADLKPRARKGEFTEKLIAAKSGAGGIALKFTVGDGTLRLSRFGGTE
jgi:hypothetical protein